MMHTVLAKWAVGVAAVLLCCSAMGQNIRRLLRGGDVSEIPQVEADGGKYFDHGKQEDPLVLLRKNGWNFLRFRIWNHPRDGYCDEAHTLALAKRAHDLGFTISLDFHYSDWWADPGKQYKPAAWKDLPFDQLVQAVYDYTKKVVSDMVAQGTPPYMVQVGNEITAGTLWPDGRLQPDNAKQWDQLCKLIDAGLRAVRDSQGDRKILTMIHLDRGGDNKGARWWFDHAISRGLNFDTIGLSYYPFWHGHLDAMQQNVDDLAQRYGKDVYIVETSYPWAKDTRSGQSRMEPGYPETPEGQAAFLKTVMQTVARIPHHRGKGFLYWAPTWIGTPKGGSGWGYLSTFDLKGNALPAVAAIGGR